jgi:hypothetical protein
VDLPSAIGLGLDIAGASIIAIGLLGSPATLAMRATSFWGSSPPTAVAEAESRADAEFGIPTITAGFIGQLIGLAVRSDVPIWLGAGAGAVFALVPLALWHWLWRPRRTMALAIEIAHYRVDDSTSLPIKAAKPDLERLVSMGPGIGKSRNEGETHEAYVARVFGVTDAEKSQE